MNIRRQRESLRSRLNYAWGSVFSNVMLVVLFSLLVTSCKEADDGFSPVDELPPPAVSVPDLFGDVLYQADGSVVGLDSIENKAIIGIYFGAGWCSACAGFTPQLVSFYEDVVEAGKSFAVVFVSFDESEDDMLVHMTDRAMPWPAVPYGGEKGADLAQRYDVVGIPTLVVIDTEGNTITTNGRADVVTYGFIAFDSWLSMSGG